MAATFDLEALPASVRPLVARAMSTGDHHEGAILSIEAHLAEGGERTPDLLVALAMLTYDDAAMVVLSRLRAASEEAVALVDEAIARGSDPSGRLAEVREVYVATSRAERARERRLRALMLRPGCARPAELVELAHRILMNGEDDELTAELMNAAAAQLDPGEPDGADPVDA